MSRICEVCGKGPSRGGSVKRRGLAKKKGGVGRRITGRSKRTFYPNLHKVKVKAGDVTKVMLVCSKCIKKGKLVKA